MLDRAAADRVALAQAAIGIDHELGHQEQRDTLGTRRRIGQFGQHQVNDVLGQIMLTTGNKDLGTGHRVAAIGLRHRLGTNDPQIGTTVRLGQTHGARPGTGIQVRQVSLLEFFTAVGVQRQTATSGQRRVQGKTVIGAVNHLLDLYTQGLGHTQPTKIGVAAQPYPATFGVGAIGLLETGGCSNHTVVPLGTFFITAAVQGRNGLRGNLAGFLKHRISGFPINGAVQPRQALPQLVSLEHFIQNETNITQGGFIVGHEKILSQSLHPGQSGT